MAKKRKGPNKSAAIKEILSANLDASPKSVVDELAAKGIKVTAQLVSNLKSHMKRQGGGGDAPSAAPKKRGRPAGSTPSKSSGAMKASSSGLSFEQVIMAKELADAMGGVEVVRAALAALDKLK